CELSVAVSNALPAVKETADFVTKGEASTGVVELIHEVLRNDLSKLNRKLTRHFLVLGTRGKTKIALSPYGPSLLICGPSACGKSTVAKRFVEALQEHHYQYCLIDPEGDYAELEGAVVRRGSDPAPIIEKSLQTLEDPASSAVICLSELPIPERPA